MNSVLILIVLFFLGCTTRETIPQIYKNTAPTQRPYSINGQIYYPHKKVHIGWKQRGIASWYGPNFHGKYTSNGEVYNMYAYTAAHKTLPMNTIVKVTNLINKKSVIVRINDRGPFVKGRIIDLSYVAGKKIGLDMTGTAPVEIKVIGFKGKNYINGYKIQVGAFVKKKGAIKIMNYYKKLGYNSKIEKNNYLYKVYITGFKSYKEARRFLITHKIAGFVIGE